VLQLRNLYSKGLMLARAGGRLLHKPGASVLAKHTQFSADYVLGDSGLRRTLSRAVWQLQPKVVQTVQHHVSYEFIWIRRTCDYLVECSQYCVLFSSRVRVRIRVRTRFSV